ncbi:MAG: hypothetical protein EAZ32_15770 [Cytophagia bacterium]|nr:MAG: hypothetical protein EAZ38_16770 [Cytophagales bacterium]TAG37338.1 MAG: hypothetical protein EAZ32_15770 [Cytophagia bacterium]TAG58821.1 MAG: hypothetical protein EAZ29_00410 [Runella slithyformis]TAG78320.1 MAG: hypothetical protein EAZ22_13840 [Cytophagales bacterium]
MKTFFTLLALAFSLIGRAQINLDTDSLTVPKIKDYNRGTYFVITPIIGNINATFMPNMVRIIDAKNFSSFNDIAAYRMGFVFNKFKMEINLVSSLVASSSFSSGAKNNQNLEIKYSFIYGGLSVGRVLVRSRNSVWSILGGIGVFESSLLLLQKTNTNFNFNQLLTTPPPGQSPLLKHISGCFEISIEHTYRPKKATSFGPSFALGVRRGLSSRSWESEYLSLQNAPTDRVTQLFFNSSFMISNNRVRKPKQP